MGRGIRLHGKSDRGLKRAYSIPLWLELFAASTLALSLTSLALISSDYYDERVFYAKAERSEMLREIADIINLSGRIESAAHQDLLKLIERPGLDLQFGPLPLVTGQFAQAGDVAEAFKRHIKVESNPVVYAYIVPHEFRSKFNALYEKKESEAQQDVNLVMSVQMSESVWLNALHKPAPYEVRALPMLAAGVVAVLGIIFTIVWTRMRFAAPLQQLADASARITKGELVEPITVSGPEFLQTATRAFNEMLQRLSSMIETQRSIMISVAHDLRTPIAAMRLRAEFIENVEERERFLSSLLEIQTMAEAVLSAAKSDQSGESLRSADLAALAESVAEDLAESQVNVSFVGGDTVRVLCRVGEVRRAIRNLCENGARYGKHARVKVRDDGEWAVICVEDDGPGIPDGELERMFDPFSRLEYSRNAHTGGYGLGLSIARWIVRGHGGEIKLENIAGGGLRALLMLPRQPPSSVS